MRVPIAAWFLVGLCGLWAGGLSAEGATWSAEAPGAASSYGSRSAEANNQGVREAQAGRFEQGIALLRQSLSLDPSDAQVKKNLSGVLTDWAVRLEQQGQLDQAVSALQEAVGLDPDNGKALVLLGDYAYVSDEDLSRAVAFWKRAHGKVPDAKWVLVSERLSQAERDLAIERGFYSVQTQHFTVRLEAEEGAGKDQHLGEALEQEYARLEKLLGPAPARFTVIVYAERNFRRVAGQRDWAVGLYDGRIRVRLDDLGSDRIQPVIAHELAHAFLAQTYGPMVPIWVHEGFAQFFQESPTQDRRPLEPFVLWAAKASWIPLKWLDHHFQQPSSREDLGRAYFQAWVVFGFLVRQAGMDSLKRFLAALQAGQPVDRAFDGAFAPLRWARVDGGSLEAAY